MTVEAPWLLPLAILLPLALAGAAFLPALRSRILSLLPLAPLPGLAAALLLPAGTGFDAGGVLLGLRLELGARGVLFLGFAAFLWAAAGIYARSYLRESPSRRFVAFWCLTLAGNLGVFIAGDVASFYAAFACVSLAAYPLVVQSRTPSAMRAGTVYIVLAMLGETALLLGFMLAAVGAESLLLADIRASLAGAQWRHAAIPLLIAGFGIKAGLVPLHVWLPLAHPAAPTPASAVLSGAIVKAGIFGLMQFLPFGAALPGWHGLLMGAGLLTVWFGIGVGLTQSNPKTILAYSTVSQMGIVVTVLAMALTAGAPETALAAASLYALHHGLAKGALFMGVGVIGASGAKALGPMLALLAIPALSIAGAPLTGGALAKLAIKPPLGGGVAEWLVTLSAIGTSLLLLRFLIAVAATAAPERPARPAPGLLLPWLAVIAAAVVMPWLLFARLTGQDALYPLAPGNLWSALWPVLAVGLIFAAVRRSAARLPVIPEGDLLAVTGALAARMPALPAGRGGSGWRIGLSADRRAIIDRWPARVERLLSRWSVAGSLLLLLALLAVALSRPGP